MSSTCLEHIYWKMAQVMLQWLISLQHFLRAACGPRAILMSTALTRDHIYDIYSAIIYRVYRNTKNVSIAVRLYV